MRTRMIIAMLIGVGNTLIAASAFAEPYQTQVTALLGTTNTSSTGSVDRKGDLQRLGITYYLRPVDAIVGPVGEQAFLTKSASLSASYRQTKSDVASDVDTIGLRARFVTRSNIIININYSKNERDSSSSASYGVGVGKYLDDRTSAVLSYQTSDVQNANKTVVARYDRLFDGSSANTYIKYDLGVGIIDGAFDSGYLADGAVVYYFNDRLSGSAGVRYSSLGDSNNTTLSIAGQYFFSQTLYGSLSYSSQSFSGGSKSVFTGLQIGARF